MTRTARCCCQDCSITVDGEPALNAICNCSSCKRRTGTAFGWSVYFPNDKVVAKTGQTRVYHRDGDAGYDRFFCTRCGTTLYWKGFGFMPEFTGVAGGCFTDDKLPEPSLSAQDKDRCAWIGLPDGWMKA